jgi:signal transduction histidine kinase
MYNLINNACKYTYEGNVVVRFTCLPIDDEQDEEIGIVDHEPLSDQ